MSDWGLGSNRVGDGSGSINLDPERKLTYEDRRRLVRELRLEAVRTSYSSIEGERFVARDITENNIRSKYGLSALPPKRQDSTAAHVTGGLAYSPSRSNTLLNDFDSLDSRDSRFHNRSRASTGTSLDEDNSLTYRPVHHAPKRAEGRTPEPLSQLDLFELETQLANASQKSSNTQSLDISNQLSSQAVVSSPMNASVKERRAPPPVPESSNGKVTEIHHHHHHHYYEPVASPIRASAGGPIGQQLHQQPAAFQFPPHSPIAANLKIRTRKKANQTPEIILKAQQLLDDAKRSAELKKRNAKSSMAASPPLPQKNAEAIAAASSSRRRSRKASVVLSELSLEKAAAAPVGDAEGSVPVVESAQVDATNDDEDLEAYEYDSDNEKGSSLPQPESAASFAKQEVKEDRSRESRGRLDSQDLLRLAETMSPYFNDAQDQDESDEEEDAGELEQGALGDGGPSDQHARQEKLEKMLESAEKAELDQDASDAPLGIVLQRQSSFVSFLSGSKASRLPRYATSRDLSPSRPPPELVQEQEGGEQEGDTMGESSRQGRASSFSGPVKKSGWLCKLGSRNKWIGGQRAWKERYFILSGNMLSYTAAGQKHVELHDQAELVPKRTFDLSDVEIATDPEKLAAVFGPAPYPHVMLIYKPRPYDGRLSRDERTQFLICHPDFKELLGWYKSIVNNALYCCEKSFSSVPPEVRGKREKKEKKLPKPKPMKPEDFYPLYIGPASHYDIFGVQPDATTREIKKKYFRMAQEMHPDKNPDACPEDFQRIADAYRVLSDSSLREKYDHGEKIKEVLRRGFDCTLVRAVLGEENEAPVVSDQEKVTLFADGKLDYLFFQPSTEEAFQPLQPKYESSVELRFVNRVLYGRNDPLALKMIKEALGPDFDDEQLDEQDTFICLHSPSTSCFTYIQFDTAGACKEMLEGIRIIRCEMSVKFAQTLAALREKGYD